jgi:hypothetical protein
MVFGAWLFIALIALVCISMEEAMVFGLRWDGVVLIVERGNIS